MIVRSDVRTPSRLALSTMSLPKTIDADGSPDANKKRSWTSEGEQDLKKPRTEDSCSQDLQVQVGFDDLPDELVVKIFSNLSTTDLLKNVARVSKRFHLLSQDPDAHVAFEFGHLWYTFTYSFPPKHEAEAIKFLKGKNKIQEVKMYFRLSIFKLAVMDQKKTTSLRLGGFYSDAFKLLAKSPQKAEQIRMLELKGNFGDDWGTPEFINLIKFDFLCGNGLEESEELGKFVFNIAMKSEKLEWFSSNLILKTGQLKKLLARHGNRLKTLELPFVSDWSDIWDVGVRQQKFKALETLDIFGNDISTDSVIAILQLENLKKLNIESLEFCPGFMTRIISSLNPKKLEEMRLIGWDNSRIIFIDSCLTLITKDGKISPDDLSTFLRAATENKELEKFEIESHHDLSEANDNRLPSTEVDLHKGQEFYLRTDSNFLPLEKLKELIRSLPLMLSSLPPMECVTINHDVAMSVKLIRRLKRQLSGDPTVFAKMYL